jgi:GntR family transcriptional regulator/MocR family aminotransferase
LYKSLQKAILEGRLRSGDRLPASRLMAKELAISRNTVMIAFEQLAAEGYLESLTGSGTFISSSLPENFVQVFSKNKLIDDPVSKARKISRNAFNVKNIFLNTNVTNDIQPFRHGIPDLENFPFKIWGKIFNNLLHKIPTKFLGYGDPAGYLPLRKAIANYLRTSRAVKCETEQVIIVSGSQQALDLSSRVLLDNENTVFMEDPGYLGARGVFLNAGINLVPIPLDHEGIKVENSNEISPGLIYVTPSHQYPLGYVMSVTRRLQLLELAEQSDCWILEDDYNSEYRYTGKPLPSLQGLDSNKRVIYTGSFSKVLFPALRLGYIVVPEDLIQPFTVMRGLTDRGNPILEQAVMAEFIAEGHFYRHIRRMRNLYLERQQILVSEVNRELKGYLRLNPADAGMHLIAWLPENEDDKTIAAFLAKKGIITSAVSEYSIKHRVSPGLILGYTAYSEKEIRTGVQKLSTALDLYFKKV